MFYLNSKLHSSERVPCTLAEAIKKKEKSNVWVLHPVTQWRTVQFIGRPMQILKCLKFPPLNLELWVCTDEFFIQYLRVWSAVYRRL